MELITKEQRKEFYHSVEWQRLREQALLRDHYECQWCKANGKVSEGVLEVDHIKDIEHYPESATDLANLRTLCKDCHNKRHNRMNYSSRKKHRKPPKWNDERWD
ncbi:HNH endonuclease [Ligilactobacillus animalis]|uniref:Putative HNH nuclease YajD n=1 Tax=Ligilactobacillus animalis TaxID=1605 RepID=A0AAJ6K1Y3_9LACO|nr:HNH endonuclease [Ligilactobacillus animalis]WHQ80658.1 HNH endonuclease [Ligilactobacillus animalis]